MDNKVKKGKKVELTEKDELNYLQRMQIHLDRISAEKWDNELNRDDY